MSERGEIYDKLSTNQQIAILPVRMKGEKMFIPTDDKDYALLGADFFMSDEPLMFFAPKEIMEAWFFGGGKVPENDLPLEVHIAKDLETEFGAPILRMRVLSETEYAQAVSDIQKSGITTYKKR